VDIGLTKLLDVKSKEGGAYEMVKVLELYYHTNQEMFVKHYAS